MSLKALCTNLEVGALRTVLAAPKPVVVQCWQGADRTGAVVAAWRIAVDGWTPALALEEMSPAASVTR